jgi:hypothetical protein
MSGNFCLLKYFQSYCEIKHNASTHPNLKQCGEFVDFDFLIYTNHKMESNSQPQTGYSDILSILSSGMDCGKYVTFEETHDKDIFGFFEDLSYCQNLVKELNNLLKSRDLVNEEIKEIIQKSLTKYTIFGNLKGLKPKKNKPGVISMIDELVKCDFTLFKEFLSKIKIFQCQSSEESLKCLIEKELQVATNASTSVANSIYTDFEENFRKWWKREGDVLWLNKNSEVCQTVQQYIINSKKEMLKSTIHIDGCDKQPVQKITYTNESTPLYVAAECGYLEAACNDQLQDFGILTKVGTDINIPNVRNNTVLYFVLTSSSTDIINFSPSNFCAACFLTANISLNLPPPDSSPCHNQLPLSFAHLVCSNAISYLSICGRSG